MNDEYDKISLVFYHRYEKKNIVFLPINENTFLVDQLTIQ